MGLWIAWSAWGETSDPFARGAAERPLGLDRRIEIFGQAALGTHLAQILGEPLYSELWDSIRTSPREFFDITLWHREDE